MSSGVMVNLEVNTTFQKLYLENKKYCYALFKIEDCEIVVESVVTRDTLNPGVDDYEDCSKSVYEKFTEDVKERTNNLTECRFAALNFQYTCQRNGYTTKQDRTIFMHVSPDTATTKQKMLYASSTAAIRNALGNAKTVCIQVTEELEMHHSEVLAKLREK